MSVATKSLPWLVRRLKGPPQGLLIFYEQRDPRSPYANVKYKFEPHCDGLLNSTDNFTFIHKSVVAFLYIALLYYSHLLN